MKLSFSAIIAQAIAYEVFLKETFPVNFVTKTNEWVHAQVPGTAKFQFSAGNKYTTFSEEQGLFASKKDSNYAISRRLDKQFKQSEHDQLVVQFEVKLEEP